MQNVENKKFNKQELFVDSCKFIVNKKIYVTYSNYQIIKFIYFLLQYNSIF